MDQTTIIEDFIKKVVKELVSTNESYELDEIAPVDIPYAIAPLVQSLKDEKFKDFVKDLSTWQYSVVYEKIEVNYSGDYGKIEIRLYTESSSGKHDYKYEPCSYTYSIFLTYEDRHWGYCECLPTDIDYREDKNCCGHGCDYTSPAFRIIKEISLGRENWQGDEHDYWNFEDSFYKSDVELAEEKVKRDKEEKVKYLQEQIKRMQDELTNM